MSEGQDVALVVQMWRQYVPASVVDIYLCEPTMEQLLSLKAEAARLAVAIADEVTRRQG